MMDDKTFQGVLGLCRFRLTADEEKHFKSQIAEILAYVETLDSIDTTGVDPDLGQALAPVEFRSDAPRPGLDPASLAALSPYFEDGHFVVPRILEDLERGRDR